ncbi:acyl-coenzyme A:6-aminopenicillanic acid acyl-transferase-domain-containing protein [Aspergillus lucknowensis]|uniref:Acyl-coenzyme A:6-aminopenicillanic acid acyl-transferase-domain-containing protein n=1 Tax=Aspergillus lucknowensis TaxID=176173 RepID=A0ABR4LGQ0_9EURO
MLVVKCAGSPREIGKQHGAAASALIARCIDFYTGMFKQTSSLAWKDVLGIAESFAGKIKADWPAYYEEMEGVAEGSGRSVLDIIALNVRTEIAFGCFSDGCTALSWQTEGRSFLAQNWDWQSPQKQNLIILEIRRPTKPAIKMVTEAGIIGKIGLNSDGVGVCLNAIRAHGVDPTRFPVHLGLRMALESSTTKQAIESLQRYGIAASAHILIADANESIGCEFTSTTTAVIPMDAGGRVVHTNHLLLEHPGVVDTAWLSDSPFRIERALKLTEQQGVPTWEGVSSIFTDRMNSPVAICRTGEIETLFNIVMDLKERRAVVRLGLPDNPEEVLELRFDDPVPAEIGLC